MKSEEQYLLRVIQWRIDGAIAIGETSIEGDRRQEFEKEEVEWILKAPDKITKLLRLVSAAFAQNGHAVLDVDDNGKRSVRCLVERISDDSPARYVQLEGLFERQIQPDKGFVEIISTRSLAAAYAELLIKLEAMTYSPYPNQWFNADLLAAVVSLDEIPVGADVEIHDGETPASGAEDDDSASARQARIEQSRSVLAKIADARELAISQAARAGHCVSVEFINQATGKSIHLRIDPALFPQKTELDELGRVRQVFDVGAWLTDQLKQIGIQDVNDAIFFFEDAPTTFEQVFEDIDLGPPSSQDERLEEKLFIGRREIIDRLTPRLIDVIQLGTQPITGEEIEAALEPGAYGVTLTSTGVAEQVRLSVVPHFATDEVLWEAAQIASASGFNLDFFWPGDQSEQGYGVNVRELTTIPPHSLGDVIAEMSGLDEVRALVACVASSLVDEGFCLELSEERSRLRTDRLERQLDDDFPIS